MTGLASSQSVLDYLEKHAPRAWCKRLLLQLILEQNISAYFTSGEILGYVPISVLIDKPAPYEEGWRDAVLKKYGRIRGIDLDNLKDNYLAKITGYLWREGSTPAGTEAHDMPFGYFYYADDIDWEEGTLEIHNFFPAESDLSLFFEDNHLRDYERDEITFSWIQFDIKLGGLCFPIDVIELLATGAPNPSNLKAQSTTSTRSPGRPPKHDWNGAFAFVVAMANTPDGLPEGSGSQAAIERMIEEWFIAGTGDTPARSQIRSHAQRIVAAIENGKKG